jgi:xanthine dehydrogenase YagT iron-sulfur-binding subunit
MAGASFAYTFIFIQKKINVNKENYDHAPVVSSRREFIQQFSVLSAGISILSTIPGEDMHVFDKQFEEDGLVRVNIFINEKKKTVEIDPRVTLLDTLREKLQLTGTKKGCDRGQCGACTVLVNGIRINSCLTLAVMCDGAHVTTIEGLGTAAKLHPMQAAFIKHDAFQCGYCTPGQICSAVGLLHENHAKTDNDIRELMSGNICRCGAYQNILEAIREVKEK